MEFAVQGPLFVCVLAVEISLAVEFRLAVDLWPFGKSSVEHTNINNIKAQFLLTTYTTKH